GPPPRLACGDERVRATPAAVSRADRPRRRDHRGRYRRCRAGDAELRGGQLVPGAGRHGASACLVRALGALRRLARVRIHHVRSRAAAVAVAMSDPRAAFIEAAVWHGTLERADAILAAHPEIASSDIHSAAILGDDAAVRRFLELDPGNATVKAGPRGWDALTHLCFSKYLRLDPARSAGFVRAAQALLDAGA